MTAVRDVGARFIAPACRYTRTLSDLRELLPRALAVGPFAHFTAPRGEKGGLGYRLCDSRLQLR